jgi:hypothetical protein
VKNAGFKLGGPDQIVQIDESVLMKRKYQRGTKVKEQWTFGMYDTTLKFGIMRYVPDRTRETLLKIIQEHVVSGTTIWSDQWAAYRTISTLLPQNYTLLPQNYALLPQNYAHGTVNHSLHFKDPESGVCTNGVEGFWSGRS